MKKNNVFELTLTALFATIILVMSLLPQIGYITIMPGVSVTLTHIPVIVGVFLLNRRNAIILGFFQGLGSMFASYLYGASAFDLAFQLPWVSIIPRMLFAWAAYEILHGLQKLVTLKNSQTILFALVSLVSVFALFYGSQAMIKNNAWNDYQTVQTDIVKLDNLISDPETLPSDVLIYQLDKANLEASLDSVYQSAVDKEATLTKLVTPIVLLLSVLFIVGYYWFIENKNTQFALIPTTFILSTITHTVLVLSWVALLKPALFSLGFTDLISVIYAIAMSNGLIEALAAVIIGSPIVVAITQYKGSYKA